MTIGNILHEYRKEHGMTQEEFSERLLLDRSSIAKVESGKRQAPKGMAMQAAVAFDDPRLYLAAQEEVTGGAITPWLDNVDLHRASVLFKTVEEMKEVLALTSEVPISKTGDQLTEADRVIMKRLLMETVEAITALTHFAAVLCKEYSFSWFGIWKEHRAELKAKKYMK
ncbi:helix-turn-helix domain-containing protein [Paenibacillus sp. ClWae2A]|uniref:helix-turn-helix transcriptional regulator n=1 Tax=Paenibacillus sp. ClWae2A TaxID=3057177 RepID=UPI0028F6A1C6|nr:helix-turn-helix domain-containing protein [Paenibacillus sp. ClWae2A]MDT9719177.1 helix-turn-helix domain-containing protein [Paenibacillus sp. ClWae2A]